MTVSELSIECIQVGERERRDLGDIESLARSIETIGLLHPIVVTGDFRLVVGQRRLRAFEFLGRSQIPAHVVGSLGDAALLIRAENDENTCRKAFTPSEAVSIGQRVAEAFRPVAQQALAEGRRRGGGDNRERSPAICRKADRAARETRSVAAAAVGMSPRTYGKAQAIVEAAQRAPDQFGQLVTQMDRTGKVDRAYRQLRVAEVTRQEPTPLPEGQFDVLLVDPPWRYQSCPNENRAIENHYRTMALEEICGLQVPAADSAIIFLWTTAPKAAEAISVMTAWGFDYRSQAIWDKGRIGMGYWFRIQHELLLVGVRGGFPTPHESARFPSIIRAPRGKHSEKPHIVHQMIEQMYPQGRRLELFARQPRPGWSVWGNQLPSTN